MEPREARELVSDLHCELSEKLTQGFLAVPMASPSLEDEIGTKSWAEDSSLALKGLDHDLG